MESDSLTIKQRTTLYIFIFFIFGMMATSCEKPDTYMRNYVYPAYANDPTNNLAGAAIVVEEGESDASIIARVRTFTYKDFSDTVKYPYIFLTPSLYLQSSDINSDLTVDNPDPKYMLFPHSISSFHSEWGWAYYEELKELQECYGRKKGEQIFCDKYLNGERTIGMILDSNY